MAYAALISLKHTINRLERSSQTQIVSPSRETIESANHIIEYIQKFLEDFQGSSTSISCSSEKVYGLNEQIREAACELEDALEFHELNQLFSESERLGSSRVLLSVAKEINSFIERVVMITDDYLFIVMNTLPEEKDAVSSRNVFSGNKSKMVGSSDEFTKIKDHLTATRSYEFDVISIVGTACTGKTTLAKKIFEQKDISRYYDHCAWVTIDPKYQLKEILLNILDHRNIDKSISELDDEKLVEHLFKSLKGRKYLIVLDDIRDTRVWEYLRGSFPDENNGSRVLLTTRFKEVALFANSFKVHEIPVMNKEESWDLLCHLVFGLKLCPPELEEAGRKIAEICKGVHLVIIGVGFFLSKADKTPEYWNKAAENGNYLFMDAYGELSKMYNKYQKDPPSCNSFPGDGDSDLMISGFVKLVSNLFGSFNAVASSMTRLYNPIKEISRDLLIPKFNIISLFGMAGIGKTTLAEEIFEEPSIVNHFDHRVWITLGPKYSGEILKDILAQMYPDDLRIERRDRLVEYNLYRQSLRKKCLIVLDDAWYAKDLKSLRNSSPKVNYTFLLTTRLEEVARFADSRTVHDMCLLNNEESWHLFREKVFGEKVCPRELEKDGKQIAENCEGLPLLIVTVAEILSKAEKTSKYWKMVANKENSVFMDANNKILKVLYPSYEYLPHHLKACFLYLGVFPQNYEIHTSMLFNLWSAEGLCEVPFSSKPFKQFAVKALGKFVSESLVMVSQKNYKGKVKTCRLHSVYCHLCTTVAGMQKFFHVLNSRTDGLAEDIKSQRRLCIQNNTLFGIKDVYNSMASISTARALLCTGPPHQYQVSICFGLRLLRVLDALTIRFYEFPIEVLELVQLMYLALTCNGKLPGSISKLENLQFLIVRRYLNIKFPGDWSYLPIEIWHMKEMKHLQIMGSNLPDPCGALLQNLLTLLDVSANSCTKEILERVPSLRKLGIQIELTPDVIEPLCCFSHISHLYRLESLKCVVVNPDLRCEVAPPPITLSMFPLCLKKLSLSGFGYPWEELSKIASLPNLEVLKLLDYAFRGRAWESPVFERLEYLLLEDTDLVYWRADNDCFRRLQRLTIRHCYKMKEIPSQSLPSFCTIELVDCNPSASKQMQEDLLRRGNSSVYVHSS